MLLPVLILATLPLAAQTWRAGAARIDITPAPSSALPMAGYPNREGHTGVHDKLYVRALVLDDGKAQGAIVTADLIGFTESVWNRVAERVTKELGLPLERLLLVATHNHGGPALARADSTHAAQLEYTRMLEDRILAALRKAKDSLQPARFGAGTGRANVNINRRARFHDGTWWLGLNPEGPSDKSVAVVKFETPSGQPIAILANYAMHGTAMGQENTQITADAPGATSRFVEQHYKDSAVVLWTSGAGADQCPLYDRSPSRFTGVLNVGRILGEEIVRVAESTRATASDGRLRGAQKVVNCPGQQLDIATRKTQNIRFFDAPPLDIRLSLLMIDRIALTGVSGEVFSLIGERLKKRSALPGTMMITHCNGSSGYLPNDEAYEQVSYEIQTSRVKPGCAERAIIDGLMELIGK